MSAYSTAISELDKPGLVEECLRQQKRAQDAERDVEIRDLTLKALRTTLTCDTWTVLQPHEKAHLVDYINLTLGEKA